MTPNLEEIIQSIKQLSASEQEKVLQWLEEKRRPQKVNGNWQERTEKFHLARRWIDEHRQEYLGQLICLDGDNLISHGEDAKKVYSEAKAKGIAIPFIEQVREEEPTLLWDGLA